MKKGSLRLMPTTASNWITSDATTFDDNLSTAEMTTGFTESLSSGSALVTPMLNLTDKELLELDAAMEEAIKVLDKFEKEYDELYLSFTSDQQDLLMQHLGSKGNICELKKKVGPCDSGIPAYYFDKYARKCRKFVYGGCLGNANRFHSLKKCRHACLSQRDREQYGANAE